MRSSFATYVASAIRVSPHSLARARYDLVPAKDTEVISGTDSEGSQFEIIATGNGPLAMLQVHAKATF